MVAPRHRSSERPGRPVRLPFARRDPLARYRAVTGVKAHVRWYDRLFSLVGLAVLVVVMGALLAISVGVLIIGARVLLDVLVS